MINSRFKGDGFKHQGLRKRLLDIIKSKGISDDHVLEAMGILPRHLFMDSGFIRFAYQDSAFPIGSGQTISQPYTVAYQTQLLEVKDYLKVLEVGTGSGYQTAVLAEMGARVFTIERIHDLYLHARLLLTELGYHAHFAFGDGYEGLPGYGPYDRILITAGAASIPDQLKQQLKIGGILVAPIGNRDHQTMVRCIRVSEEEYSISKHGNFVFVPLLKGKTMI
ncbi:MAG: protein-L-isoaspartate(D-aspartate) O-methyltransferase [Bacteroidales bacterium]|nr:protein-L-isoaspartate(D-aspartate) O-methyltransferase [Bacteroidales bacterium]